MDVVFSLSERVTVLHQGRVIAEGKPEDIKKNEEVHMVYLGQSDAHALARRQLRRQWFDHHDGQSAQRLLAVVAQQTALALAGEDRP
jgi:ABC-type multidrug transport system ATPase subunit